MLWRKIQGVFFAVHDLTGWLSLVIIFGIIENGNVYAGIQLQETNTTKLLTVDIRNSLSSPNSLDNNNINNNNINNNNNNLNTIRKLKPNFYTQNQNISNNNNNKINNNNNIKGNNSKLTDKLNILTNLNQSDVVNINNKNKLNNNNNNININNKTNQLLTATVINQSDLIMNFSTENSSIITYQVGSVALMPCSVQNIGEGLVVSWIRRKDYHLMTVGSTTYSSDERFSAIHLQDSEDWALQIKFVQVRDAGIYECQISTHPPISIFLHLNVVEARADIPGPTEKYLKPGSTLRLSCKILQSMDPPLYIFWYHNNRMINYDLHRGVNVSTESDNRYSELLISQTSIIHSGNYTCSSNNAVSASILVHILNGENPAAMQHGEHGNGIHILPSIKLLFSISIIKILLLLLFSC